MSNIRLNDTYDIQYEESSTFVRDHVSFYPECKAYDTSVSLSCSCMWYLNWSLILETTKALIICWCGSIIIRLYYDLSASSWYELLASSAIIPIPVYSEPSCTETATWERPKIHTINVYSLQHKQRNSSPSIWLIYLLLHLDCQQTSVQASKHKRTSESDCGIWKALQSSSVRLELLFSINFITKFTTFPISVSDLDWIIRSITALTKDEIIQ